MGKAFRTDKRRSPRYVPTQCATSLTLESGDKRDARIISVSQYGVSILADFTCVSFERVAKIGHTATKPLRRFPGGATFLFERPLSPDDLGLNLLL